MNEELASTNEDLLIRNREHSVADAIVSSVRIPLLVLDRELRVLRANPSFYKEFGLTHEVAEGKLLRDLGARQWDLPELLERLGKVLAPDGRLVDHEVVFPGSETTAPRILRIDADRIPGDAERAEFILLSIEDVTEHRTRVDALELASQRKVTCSFCGL